MVLTGATHAQHLTAHLYRHQATSSGLDRSASMTAACSWRVRTESGPRISDSIPCTAAASPCTVVTAVTPRVTAAVLIS